MLEYFAQRCENGVVDFVYSLMVLDIISLSWQFIVLLFDNIIRSVKNSKFQSIPLS